MPVGRRILFLVCKVCKRLLLFCKQAFTFALLCSFFLSPVYGEPRFVLLAVGEEGQSGEANELRLRCEELRNRLGLTSDSMPVKTHLSGGLDVWSRRLGLDGATMPVLGVVLWNESESLGPRRFVGDAFAERADPGDALRVVQSYLRLTGQRARALPVFHRADTLPIPHQEGLVVESLRFEASGRPNNLTNFAVRLRNESLETLTGVEVQFFLRRMPAQQWMYCEMKTLEKVASHHLATAEFLGNSKALGLLDSDGNAVACQYKVVVKVGSQEFAEMGSFTPSERPVD